MTNKDNKVDPQLELENSTKDIEESIKETESNQLTLNKDNSFNKREGINVKGKVVCLAKEFKAIIKKFPNKKEEVSLCLAIALEDEDSIAYYKKLAKERRNDFLKNCLEKTFEAFLKNKIKTTKAKYFTGIVKNKTAEQKRIQDYKRKHYPIKR